MQNSPLGNHLLDMVLSLGEYVEDVRNTTLANFCKLPFFVQHPA